MKIKIISLLICTLFLTSIFSGLTTAKNHLSIDTSIANSNVDLTGNPDLIKITNENPDCDIDNNFVVYAGVSSLYLYNIYTEETDEVYVGGDIVFPKISENRVVYYDFLYMGFKMYNITSGEKTDLIVTNWEGGDADSFQFFGNYIVYENYDSDLYSTEIFLYNIATSKNIQLTDSPGEDYSENPYVYKNIVAWQLTEGNLADIVMYNIDSEEYSRVTNTSEFESETYPSVYDNNIVYSYFYYDKLNGTIMYGLKMYDIAAKDETTIFTAEEPTGSTPEIFGNVIAYSEPGVSLRLYDLIKNYNVSIYVGSMLVTPWNLNGNYVAFTVLEDGVYLYNYNNPPDAPTIDGPNSGKPGTTYEYSFSSVDPEGHDVAEYIVDWDDGTSEEVIIGPFASGEEVQANHTWDDKNTYSIKAKSKDIFGDESNWSEFKVEIPRNKATFNSLFNWLFERFSLLKRLLNLFRSI